MSQQTLCPHCNTRQPEPKNYFNHDQPDYCDICSEASSLVHTSIDDARQSIKGANIDVIYMAAKFEFQRPSARISMMNMLRSRLKKLTGLRYPKFPGEPD